MKKATTSKTVWYGLAIACAIPIIDAAGDLVSLFDIGEAISVGVAKICAAAVGVGTIVLRFITTGSISLRGEPEYDDEI